MNQKAAHPGARYLHITQGGGSNENSFSTRFWEMIEFDELKAPTSFTHIFRIVCWVQNWRFRFHIAIGHRLQTQKITMWAAFFDFWLHAGGYSN